MIGILDFAGLPPEVNSARMYAGAGAGSLTAAAAAWEALASELSSTASSYRAVVSALTSGPWVGPSSASMAAAVSPYLSWMNATAVQASQTASQLGSAVAAYETAFAATVPPVEIEVNRALLASLLATNTLGQNSAAIASTEAQYAEMWAQDAAAMYGYAGASAAATRLTAFTSPQPTTSETGTTAQGPAVSNAAAAATGSSTQSTLASVPNLLQGLSSPAASVTGNPIIDFLNGPNPILDVLNSSPLQTFHTLSGGTVGYQILSEGLNFDASGSLLTLAPPVAAAWNPLVSSLSAPAAAASGASGAGALDAGLGSSLVGSSGPAGLGSAGVSAGLGEGASVGNLSVPRSWGTSPAIRLAATALPAASLEGMPQAATAPGGFYGGMPPMGPVASVVNAPRGDQSRLRPGSRQKVVAALPGEQEDPAAPWVQAARSADGDVAVAERDELNQLRKAIADVTRQRDVLKRTAATLIKEATNK